MNSITHTSHQPGFEALIDTGSPVAQLGNGFTFTEGPLWHPTEQYLLFSDMPADVRRRWDKTGVRETLKSTHKANGLTYDTELNLVACEHASSSLTRLRVDGTREVLASHFEGRELNSPNDVCQRSCGALYFTDPWYGRMPHFGVERPRELGFQGVYRVRPGQAPDAPDLLVDRYLFSQPNGLCFSADEMRLYINDTEQANIRVFDVRTDGTLHHGRLFATGICSSTRAGVPDGMKCDALGNVWVTAPGGLWVFDPNGRRLGEVAIPELAANLAWGGEDWRTLFVCASTSLYALRTKVGPRNEPYMRRDSEQGAELRRLMAGGTGGNGSGAAADASPTSHGTSSNTTTPVNAADHGPAILDALTLDPSRCALIIQDMQNDVVMDGGAFASSGSPQHCREQNAIDNIRRLADACRARGIPVIHVWFKCPPGHAGIPLNAPLFEGVLDANALVEGTWGSEPVPGLEPLAVDHVVTKMRMSAFEGSQLEAVLRAEGRDLLIETGAWTNMSIEHTARTGADMGYTMVIPEDACSSMNADWHRASIGYALQNVAAVTRVEHVIRALQAAI